MHNVKKINTSRFRLILLFAITSKMYQLKIGEPINVCRKSGTIVVLELKLQTIRNDYSRFNVRAIIACALYGKFVGAVRTGSIF